MYAIRRAESALKRVTAKVLGREPEQDRRDRVIDAELTQGRRAREGGAPTKNRRRNILFITVDQQRYDALGVNGGKVARTPAANALAEDGINFRRAHVQNVVCMPSRSTMLTGQHPRTHGVICNGIPLPDEAPSVAGHLRREAGYRTALIGKAHFDPHMDFGLEFFENRAVAFDLDGPWHGFEHMEFATHGPVVAHHYATWLWENHPDQLGGFAGVLTGTGGGDTGAVEVAHNPIARENYHTDWVADRTIEWLETLSADEPFFCWVSFPDPHHPFDPPLEEVRDRIDWRDLDLPAGHPGTRERARKILGDRPRHWLDWYDGRFRNPEGGTVNFVPGQMTDDQLREVNAMIHVENELIDEACARIFAWLSERGLDEHTDIFYTSDHGEMQGDYGLLFKGPYHVESLLRIPMIWRPAPSANVDPAEVTEPVGHVDLAPTFCHVAGVDVPDWMEGKPLPSAPGSDRKRVLTTFDSQFAPVGMHLQTIYQDGHLVTAYRPSTRDQGGDFKLLWKIWGTGSRIPDYRGGEGELYDCDEDPHQWANRWDDPAKRSLRDDLLAELRDHLPAEREVPLEVKAPT